MAHDLNGWAGMADDTRSWLVGVPFETHGARPSRERLSLSNHQKRELAGVTALVMASTVFFLTPLMVPPGSPPGLTPLVAAGGAATPDAVIPEPQPVVLSASVVTPAAGAPRADARLRRAPLKAVRAGFAATRVSSVQAASARETARSKRKGVSGAMVRVLVGTGRHRVQPFPTPASGD